LYTRRRLEDLINAYVYMRRLGKIQILVLDRQRNEAVLNRLMRSPNLLLMYNYALLRSPNLLLMYKYA
jgi:hypothetical protein